jgi:hypothetical protein
MTLQVLEFVILTLVIILDFSEVEFPLEQQRKLIMDGV